MTMNPAATAAYFAATAADGPFDHQRDAFEQGYDGGIAAERARGWQNCEQIDFHVTAAPGQDGITWIWLNCSACGHVAATAQGEPSDLGGMSVMAQSHLERKHADLLDGTP